MIASPMPPGNGPNSWPMLDSSFSATRDFSSITPMNTNSGTAIRVLFSMIPNSRLGTKVRSEGEKVPVRMPPAANSSAVPPRTKATG
jgi:hypothetical protein